MTTMKIAKKNETRVVGALAVAIAVASTCGACGGTHDEAGSGPAGSGDTSDASSGGSGDASTIIGPDGGTLSSLVFAVVGDTRPPSPNDTAGYPTPIITKVYANIAARQPQPAFVLGTGDYQFSSSAATASAQMDLYLGARAQYQGHFFPVMGNHECTGGTTSNCGPGTSYGLTGNYTSFLSKLLAPIGKTDPYYALHVSAEDGSWTAKYLFLAANAWTQPQNDWLDAAMAEATTYTFIIRHEPAIDTTVPGVGPSEAIMAKHPYTFAIVGHSHTFRRNSNREVIIGNGGAPLTGSVNYGYGLFARRDDGVIDVDMIDYQTGQPTPSQHFAIKADGSLTQ